MLGIVGAPDVAGPQIQFAARTPPDASLVVQLAYGGRQDRANGKPRPALPSIILSLWAAQEFSLGLSCVNSLAICIIHYCFGQTCSRKDQVRPQERQLLFPLPREREQL